MEMLRTVLKQHWGYDDFLPLQREAMSCVMGARDSVVILPTGGGKSLCFQAPAMAMAGMAVVVSPLISLMKDQVDALRLNGIAAAKIDSGMSVPERQAVHQSIKNRTLKLLYVSPERLAQSRFIEYLQEAGVSFFAIDEAHCISQWGHDFRPEYRELRSLRVSFPEKAIHAYTATATPHVRDDIVNELCLRNPSVLTGSYDRPNLVYRVERRSDGFAQIRSIIEAHPGESGIIYCIRRADVDTLCNRLRAGGFKALPYHAGMDDNARKRNQEAFTKDETDIVVATVAFGMGIDKSNVRYVIHAAMPKSIEHYHQETGRAGRDGLPAECRLLYSYADFRLWKSIIEKSEDQGAEIAAAKLQDILRYCGQAVCRHRALVTYFGQVYPDEPCGACDTCSGDGEVMENAAVIARAILGCVAELGSMAGPTYTTLVLTGSREERVLAKGHHELASYGALASEGAQAVRDWIEQLARQGYLEKTGEYNVLVLTRKGVVAQQRGETPQLAQPCTKRPQKSRPSKVLPSETDQGLFEVLRKVRRMKAEELNVPPFVVFGDASLRDMAQRKPADRAGLLSVYGVGQRKCEAFGDEFIAAIRDYRESHPESGSGAPEIFGTTPRSQVRTPKSDTQRRASDMFALGHSIEEVAESLERRPSTIEGYLLEYIREREITDPNPWISASVFERVREAAASTGGERMRPIRDFLTDEVSYEEIRICMACLRNTGK